MYACEKKFAENSDRFRAQKGETGRHRLHSVILKVLLVNLLTAVNFAEVFKKTFKK